MYSDSWFSESQASNLYMAEAFRTRRLLRVEAFTELAFIAFSKNGGEVTEM